MYYPMRSIRTQDFHLIHNLNFLMPFPIDQDFFISPTFQDILRRTRDKLPLPWYKTLQQYYYREQWELYDLRSDPSEVHNQAANPIYHKIFLLLQAQLKDWQNKTADPWICAPNAVLEFQGVYKTKPQCLSLDNSLPYKPPPSVQVTNILITKETSTYLQIVLPFYYDTSVILVWMLSLVICSYLTLLVYSKVSDSHIEETSSTNTSNKLSLAEVQVENQNNMFVDVKS